MESMIFKPSPTVPGAVENFALLIVEKRYLKSHDFMERGHKSGQDRAQNIKLLVNIGQKITIQN